MGFSHGRHQARAALLAVALLLAGCAGSTNSEPPGPTSGKATAPDWQEGFSWAWSGPGGASVEQTVLMQDEWRYTLGMQVGASRHVSLVHQAALLFDPLTGLTAVATGLDFYCAEDPCRDPGNVSYSQYSPAGPPEFLLFPMQSHPGGAAMREARASFPGVQADGLEVSWTASEPYPLETPVGVFDVQAVWVNYTVVPGPPEFSTYDEPYSFGLRLDWSETVQNAVRFETYGDLPAETIHTLGSLYWHANVHDGPYWLSSYALDAADAEQAAALRSEWAVGEVAPIGDGEPSYDLEKPSVGLFAVPRPPDGPPFYPAPVDVRVSVVTFGEEFNGTVELVHYREGAGAASTSTFSTFEKEGPRGGFQAYTAVLVTALHVGQPGRYVVEARVLDAAGNEAATTEETAWVAPPYDVKGTCQGPAVPTEPCLDVPVLMAPDLNLHLMASLSQFPEEVPPTLRILDAGGAMVAEAQPEGGAVVLTVEWSDDFDATGNWTVEVSSPLMLDLELDGLVLYSDATD